MNTLQTKLGNENQEVKLLFRLLFLFQNRLENNLDSSFQGDQEIEEIVLAIDRLLEGLIAYSIPEKN